MTLESSQTVTINIPLEFDRQTRELIGEDIVDFIRQRTERGLDKNNRRFTGYSDSYANSTEFIAAGKSKSRVDLELSGDMMSDLAVLDATTAGFIVIGYRTGESNNKAAWQRNNLNPNFPRRDFLGITSKDLSNIIARYSPLLNQQVQEERNRRDRIAEEARKIISRIRIGN